MKKIKVSEVISPTNQSQKMIIRYEMSNPVSWLAGFISIIKG